MKKGLLCAEAIDGDDVSEEMTVATRNVITAAGHKVTYPKKGYVELVRSCASGVQAARCEFQFASHELNIQ